MKIMGIDPGTQVMGYGVILSDNDDNPVHVVSGAWSEPRRNPLPLRLHHFHQQLLALMREQRPDVVALEHPFVGQNVKSALDIGQAQAVALIAAAELDIPCYQYSPAQIKQTVTDFGRSDKSQVQIAVRLQLGMTEIPEPHDAADALATAICHQRQRHLADLLGQG